MSMSISPASISCYLNVIRLLHLESGFPNPLHHNFYLSSLLRGIRRNLSTPPKQKLPMTPSILLSMYTQLDLSNPIMVSFWAASLVAFFCFFRKSTLLPNSSVHNCSTQMCVSDVTISDSLALIKVKHTKTLQFRDRLLQVPLPLIPGSPLCPVTPLRSLLHPSLPIPPHAPLFSYPLPKGGYSFLTHNSFSRLLRLTLSSCGISPSDYSGHSFRRGGASFAFSLGVPSELIKAQGDWSSDVYIRYLSSPLSDRIKLANLMAHNVPKKL